MIEIELGKNDKKIGIKKQDKIYKEYKKNSVV